MADNKKLGKLGMGWLRDYPDFRDFTMNWDKVSPRLKRLGQVPIKEIFDKIGISNLTREDTIIPDKIDLRQWCSPIDNQESIGSCTAHAGVGMVEYYEKRAFNTHIDASRLFLYKTTRNLLELQGDTGTYLRSTMAALTLFGVPPEKYWPYVIEDYDKEPTAFCYSFAQNYQAIQYIRLDPVNVTGDNLLKTIKVNLAAGLPSMFGFTVYSSIYDADKGKIPYPSSGDSIIGGHAIMAVGYDNDIEIKNVDNQTMGTMLIRNSWGTGWGDAGYGWLPYNYVLNGLAVDWWTIIRNEWVDTGEFEL
jgi:C1A family cysteine protease